MSFLCLAAANGMIMLMRLGFPEGSCGNGAINKCSPCVSARLSSLSSFTASTMASQDVAARCYPTFNTPGADAVLSSLDSTLYRLPSFVL
ncbi:uncharacterized protein BT62DRAFT_691684 [Guyanagaster necrorhizus]|uniref:Secreted protein n=1 Tax=Guyanagaster necrorhizus TaxID=856835 RepID=A0A9P8ALK1_9AGAR|nr:uncharacterized protein BT62DRAFT_691684 [Guyanagaster necrorhizus MCA 3950]KAG7439731.1 hypothetical protein BT62DRAFT_691684 [Guyanagaster necrorhizus MCA 3950]